MKNNFRSTIKTRLNVLIAGVTFETTRAEINHANSSFVFLAEKDVLRLQVGVHDALFVQEGEGNEDLACESSDQLHWEGHVFV